MFCLALAIAIAIALHKHQGPAIKYEDSTTSETSKVLAAPRPEIQQSDAAESNSFPPDNTSSYVRMLTLRDDLVFQDRGVDSEKDPVIQEFIASRPAAQYRVVSVNTDELFERIRATDQTQTLELRLLSEEPIVLISKMAKEHVSGWQTGLGTWLGFVSGDETSSASFVVANDGTVDGYVRSLNLGRIKIEPIKSTSLHLIWLANSNLETQID